MDSPIKAKPGRPRKDATPQKSLDPTTSHSPDRGRPIRGTRAAALTCQTCGKIFNSVAARFRHNHIHTGDRPFACGYCGEQFKRVDELHKHETKHEGGDNYCCYICESEVENQDELVKHMKTHSIDIVPHVSSAGYTFRSSAVVKRYRELFQSGQSQPCYVCFEECPTPEELLAHLSSHTALELIKGSTDRNLWKASVSYAENEYTKWRTRRSKMSKETKANKDRLPDTGGYTHICRVCHQMFKGAERLFSHWMQKKGRTGHVGRVGEEGYDTHIFSLNMDKGVTAFKCELCDKTLKAMTVAVEHFESHYKDNETKQSEEKKHEEEEEHGDGAEVENNGTDRRGLTNNENNSADITGDETNDLLDIDLDSFDISHSSPGKVVCPICNKTLKTSKLLRHHIATHKGEKSFLCPVCGKLYSRPEDLKQHIVRHVSQKYREGNAVEIDSVFSCDICPEVFASEKDLEFHGVFHGVYRPGTKTYTEGQSTMCPICGKMLQKATSLVSHIKLHDQGRDFKCQFCGRAFRSERNKERHEKIHSGVKDFRCEICGKGLSRKAEYLAHVQRHGTDPTFNGKAGRKKGTKVVDNKVVLIKDIYRPQETKDSKPKTRLSRKQVIHLDGTNQIFLPAESEYVTSNQRQTLVCYPEKTIIPYKNRKMKYELVTIDDYSNGNDGQESIPSQSVETQTDALTPEQSLAHNIEIIDHELRAAEIVAAANGAEGDAADSAAAGAEEDDAIIVIVQDPTTGENEVLTIKSFQEGASKLISPNEELMKALESFQKNKTVSEEVVTLPVDSGVDTENIQIKTEIDDITTSVPIIQVQTETDNCGNMNIKTEIDESTETSQSSSVVQSCSEAVNQTSLLSSPTTQHGIQEDPFHVTTEDNQLHGDLEDITLQTCEPSTPDDSPVSAQIPINRNVKVVSFTLDEATGVLLPVYPDDDAAIPIPPAVPDVSVSSVGSGGFYNIADAAGWTGEGPVSVLLDAEGDRAAVEALMQMKSPEHHRLMPQMNISGSGDHVTVTSPPPTQSTSPESHVMSSVSPVSTISTCGASLLKCTLDGRVLKTPSGAPAVCKSTVNLSPSPHKYKVKVLPVENSPGTNPEPDYQKITGDVVNVPDAMVEAVNSIVDVPDVPDDVPDVLNDVHDDDDEDSCVPHDDSEDYEPVKKRKRRSKKDLSPVQPVRKSLRKNSYEGVSKIVASLIGPRRKSGVKNILKSDPDSTKDDVSVNKTEDTPAADAQVKESVSESVKCNICKQVLARDKLREHIDTNHGRTGYKCGLCGQGYENNIDLHMHLLGHEKAVRVRKTLSLFSEDMESSKHQLEARGSSVLGGAASAAILALERGGDLQEALAMVDVDVDQMLLEAATIPSMKTPTKAAVQTEKAEDPSSGRRSSPRIKANLKSNQTKGESSTDRTGAVTDTSSSVNTSESTADTTTPAETIKECDVPVEAGGCAACRDSFMSSFQLQKQEQEGDVKKQHTCGKTSTSLSSVDCADVEEEGTVPAGGAVDDDSVSKEVLPCVCGLCGYSFSNVNLLTRHVKAHYQEKPFACNLCNKKYARRDELTKHRLTHQKTVVHKQKTERRKFLPKLKNGTFPCHLCKETFKTYQNRYTHVLCHENTRKSSPDKIDQTVEQTEASQKLSGDISDLTCDVCGLVLSGPRHLERHKLVHTGERTWLCQDCGKSFLRNDDLRVHRKRQHSQENSVLTNDEDSEQSTFFKKCPFCNKTFTSFGSFRNHVKTHKSEKLDGSLKCDICGKVFIKHISLRNHKQKHGDTYRRGMKRNIRKGEQAPSVYFNCEICDTRIKNKSNFIRHMKLHNEGKDLFCSHCKKGFARSADLKMHERLHTGERPFLCNICGKGFTSNSALGHHVKLHDQPVIYKFSCTQCECLFASRKEFRTHVKTCTPKTMEIVFIEDMDTVPIETIHYIEQTTAN